MRIDPYAAGPVADTQSDEHRNQLLDAYILAIGLGFLGALHFHLGRTTFGVLYLFTFGLFGVGYIVDLFRVPSLVKAANSESPTKKSLSDAYLLWFIFGFFGIHHFYLERSTFGLLYLCTCGLLGVGWIADIFRMDILVKRANKPFIERNDGKKHLDDAYLCLFPFGFLGLHHFYLRRPCWGVLYIFTFGALGVGWVIDAVRLQWLVRECNTETA